MEKWWCSLWVKHADELFNEFLDREDAGQGWPELGDLSPLVRQSDEKIEESIQKRFWSAYEMKCSRTQVSTFRYILSPEIAREDIIVARHGSKIYGIGIIKDSNYCYWPESVDYNHRIKKVSWVAHIFPEYKGYIPALGKYAMPDKPIHGIKKMGERWSQKIDEILAVIQKC